MSVGHSSNAHSEQLNPPSQRHQVPVTPVSMGMEATREAHRKSTEASRTAIHVTAGRGQKSAGAPSNRVAVPPHSSTSMNTTPSLASPTGAHSLSESSGSSGSSDSRLASSKASGSFRPPSTVSSAGSAVFSSNPRAVKTCGKPPLSTGPKVGKKRPLGAYNGRSDVSNGSHKRRAGVLAEEEPEEDVDDADNEKEIAEHSDNWCRPSASPPATAKTRQVDSNASNTGNPLLASSRVASSSLSTERPLARKPNLTTRVAEYLFHHSSGLLHHGKLENEARTSDVVDEIRRQKSKQEKYERKIRSLLRELERLDPVAAAAYMRGESIALHATSPTRQPRPPPPPQPCPSTEARKQDESDMLIPPKVPELETSIRATLQERRAGLDSFSQDLAALDEFADVA